VGGFTRVGRERERNEDHVVVAAGDWGGAPCRLAVVCDGIAAGAHSELASAGAARAAVDSLLAAAGADAAAALRQAVAVAHRAVCTAGIEAIEGRAGPGTTLVAAVAREARLDVAWVGDSRAYLIPPPPDPAELLTHDHSWVNLVVDSGTLSEEDARASRWSQMVTRCVGPLEDPDPYRPPEPSLRSLPVAPGSLVVLCSDGFWAEFDGPEALAAAVADGLAAAAPDDAEALAAWLVDRARELGADDDVTVAVIVV
jgi:serine/threonine protein phosphatase PrpC